jgi:hypothetical protein
VCYKISIFFQEVLMPTRTGRFQRAQLELFQPRSEAIHWHKLPCEIQQKAVTIVAKLLREHAAVPLRPATAKESNHE